LPEKYFCLKNIFAQKIFLPKKYFRPKNIFAQKISWSNNKQIWTEGPKIAAEGCL
jgi:hypothetical protein